MSIRQPTPVDSRSETPRPDDRAPVDGRTARRDRNRCAVLDAVIELFAEGDLHPAAQDVADRSGVSLRSVYRYFDDIDDLVYMAIERRLDGLEHRLEATPDPGPLDERIRRFCSRRLELYADLRPVYRASAVRAAHPDVANRARHVREQLGVQVRVAFGPELDSLPAHGADTVADIVDAVTQLDAIERLVSDRGRDLLEVQAHLRNAVCLALGQPEAARAIGA